MQLRQLNPGIKIFGLYGGEEAEFPKFQKYLQPFLEHNYCIRNQKDRWKWKNSDLAVRLWFRDFGKKIDFDILHIVEWDLLFFRALEKIYPRVSRNALNLTALTPLKLVEQKWYWTSREPAKSEWEKLTKLAETKFKYSKQPYASLGPGATLPRKFLEKFSSIPVPDLGNDELRLPLFGQIFGFKLIDTGFRRWFSKEDSRFFNCNGDEIPLKVIIKELKEGGGRKAFHPYRKRLSIFK